MYVPIPFGKTFVTGGNPARLGHGRDHAHFCRVGPSHRWVWAVESYEQVLPVPSVPFGLGWVINRASLEASSFPRGNLAPSR
jgi:hypothetical protein